jgi:hypothetical protein
VRQGVAMQPLMEEFEKRNRLRMLLPFLESKVKDDHDVNPGVWMKIFKASIFVVSNSFGIGEDLY